MSSDAARRYDRAKHGDIGKPLPAGSVGNRLLCACGFSLEAWCMSWADSSACPSACTVCAEARRPSLTAMISSNYPRSFDVGSYRVHVPKPKWCRPRPERVLLCPPTVLAACARTAERLVQDMTILPPGREASSRSMYVLVARREGHGGCFLCLLARVFADPTTSDVNAELLEFRQQCALSSYKQ
ncbi:hypothetical protein VTO42DRAFT_1960 [Malbranchea cinnamomea]